MPYSPATGFQAIVDILKDLESIGNLWFSANPPQDSGAGGYPIVWVCPLRWIEEDDVDPVEPVRVVNFEVRLITRGDGNVAPFEQLDQLATEILTAIEQNDLGGALPAETRCVKGHWTGKYPEETLTLECTFAYLRDDPTA
jgi:hypothetical protein